MSSRGPVPAALQALCHCRWLLCPGRAAAPASAGSTAGRLHTLWHSQQGHSPCSCGACWTRHPAARPCSQAPCRDCSALSSWPDPAPSPALCCELLLPVVLPGGFPLDPHCSPHCADALRWVHAPGWHVAPGDRRPLSVPCTRGDAGSWDTGAAITCPGIRCEHNAQGRGSPPVRAGVQL